MLPTLGSLCKAELCAGVQRVDDLNLAGEEAAEGVSSHWQCGSPGAAVHLQGLL